MTHEGKQITHCRFPPEEEQLLRSGHLVIVNGDLFLSRRARVMDDARFEWD
jgi:hypothetical protein